MRTLSYVLGTEKEIEIGDELYFGQLWDGNGDGEELLESGAIAMWSEEEDEVDIDFEIIEKDEDVLKTIVRVTDIY